MVEEIEGYEEKEEIKGSVAHRISIAILHTYAQVLHYHVSTPPQLSHTPLISTAGDLLYVAGGE